jgi:hypothetical protein
MRFEFPGAGNVDLDVIFRITRPIFATLGVMADEILERGVAVDQTLREIEDFHEAAIPQDQAQFAVDHADALRQGIEQGLHLRQNLLTLDLGLPFMRDVMERAGEPVVIRDSGSVVRHGQPDG